jgi:hypothetical protein
LTFLEVVAFKIFNVCLLVWWWLTPLGRWFSQWLMTCRWFSQWLTTGRWFSQWLTTGSWKFNYHTITATTTPLRYSKEIYYIFGFGIIQKIIYIPYVSEFKLHWKCNGQYMSKIGSLIKLIHTVKPITTDVMSSNLDQGEVYHIMW